MKRTHIDNIGTVKEFDNGNINIKFDLSGVYKNESDIINLLWLLDWVDCYLIGEEFCLSNYDMGCMLYNVHSDLVYTVSFSDLAAAFNTGKVMKLYGTTPNKYDREQIEQYFGE